MRSVALSSLSSGISQSRNKFVFGTNSTISLTAIDEMVFPCFQTLYIVWEEVKEKGIERSDLNHLDSLGYSLGQLVELWGCLETEEDKQVFQLVISHNYVDAKHSPYLSSGEPGAAFGGDYLTILYSATLRNLADELACFLMADAYTEEGFQELKKRNSQLQDLTTLWSLLYHTDQDM